MIWSGVGSVSVSVGGGLLWVKWVAVAVTAAEYVCGRKDLIIGLWLQAVCHVC